MAKVESLVTDNDLACMSVAKLAETLECSRMQAYEFARRLPEGSLVYIGKRGLRVRVVAVRRALESGGLRAEGEEWRLNRPRGHGPVAA